MTGGPGTANDHVRALIAAGYLPEEAAAGAPETPDAAASAVFSVRLQPDVHEAVKLAAAQLHTTPSALIRQWVTERVESSRSTDLPAAVAALRRDVETIASLVATAGCER